VIFTLLFGRLLAGEFRQGPKLVDDRLRAPSNLLEAVRRRKGLGPGRRFDQAMDALIDRRLDALPGDDVLWLLLSSREPQGPALSRRQIRDTIMSLIAAGQDTTTNCLVWTFYLLSRHPQVLAKLERHLGEVLGGRAPAHDDFANLGYLDQVMKESMRLYPPGWVIGRVARTEVKLDRYTIPAGTRFLISQWVSHRRADAWPDADAFVPERWEPGRTVKPHQAAYYPFGLGRRICVGKSLSELEVMLVLAIVLQRFHPQLQDSRVIESLPFATLKPKGRVLARLQPARSHHPMPSTLEVAPATAL
jgi:cytochrome P450